MTDPEKTVTILHIFMFLHAVRKQVINKHHGKFNPLFKITASDLTCAQFRILCELDEKHTVKILKYTNVKNKNNIFPKCIVRIKK